MYLGKLTSRLTLFVYLFSNSIYNLNLLIYLICVEHVVVDGIKTFFFFIKYGFRTTCALLVNCMELTQVITVVDSRSQAPSIRRC